MTVNGVIGAIAQLGERNTGSVEVGGSIPPSSTILSFSINKKGCERNNVVGIIYLKKFYELHRTMQC